MKPNQKQMIASVVKEGRIAKGYTQKELSELSNISIRSIQRIENAQIMPRSYTLRVLSEILGVSFDILPETTFSDKQVAFSNRPRKIILSAGLSLVCLLLFWAFLAQSKFPETDFEFLLWTACAVTIICVVLWFTWRTEA